LIYVNWYEDLTGLNVIPDFFFIIVSSVEDSPSRYQKNCAEEISFEASGEYTINKEQNITVPSEVMSLLILVMKIKLIFIFQEYFT
jgi:plastocyanin domain-containing protein